MWSPRRRAGCRTTSLSAREIRSTTRREGRVHEQATPPGGQGSARTTGSHDRFEHGEASAGPKATFRRSRRWVGELGRGRRARPRGPSSGRRKNGVRLSTRRRRPGGRQTLCRRPRAVSPRLRGASQRRVRHERHVGAARCRSPTRPGTTDRCTERVASISSTSGCSTSIGWRHRVRQGSAWPNSRPAATSSRGEVLVGDDQHLVLGEGRPRSSACRLGAGASIALSSSPSRRAAEGPPRRVASIAPWADRPGVEVTRRALPRLQVATGGRGRTRPGSPDEVGGIGRRDVSQRRRPPRLEHVALVAGDDHTLAGRDLGERHVLVGSSHHSRWLRSTTTGSRTRPPRAR